MFAEPNFDIFMSASIVQHDKLSLSLSPSRLLVCLCICVKALCLPCVTVVVDVVVVTDAVVVISEFRPNLNTTLRQRILRINRNS